jgi:SNF2 family DNA or RNA helicase
MVDATISLFSYEGDNFFQVDGELGNVAISPRLKASVKALGGVFKSENSIIFQYFDGFQEAKYTDVEKFFLKNGIKLSQDVLVDELLKKLNNENEAFEIFSNKAKQIRNNEHNLDDFKEFTEVIHNSFKERTLYDLQLLSAYHLAFSQNSCNFSVPGTGKTSTVYGAYAYLKSLMPSHPKYAEKHVNRLLIISPLAAFFPWKDEYEKCFGTKPKFKELVGLNAYERSAVFHSTEEVELILISYQSAAINESDIENIQDYLKRHDVMLVLDEAHKIKNTDGGKIAEGIKSLARYAKSRVVLTGTPAPNGYQDLFNLYKFIWPTKNIIPFPLPYLREMSQSVSPSITANIHKLTDCISPFFIRITKSSLKGLPPPVEHKPVNVTMSESQRLVYEYIENKYLSGDANSLDSMLKKARMIRLMQAASNPILLSEAVDQFMISSSVLGEPVSAETEILDAIEKYRIEIPNKYLAVKDQILEIQKSPGPDGKVIVWMLFVKSMHLLKDYLEKNNISCELLYGATPNENEFTPEEVKTREKIISNFHNENCPYRVIIANPFAVGESISLHKACRNAMYLEKNFNAAMYIQSKDRIHRYGLKPSDIVNYYHFVSENTIDEVIHARLLEKEEAMLYLIEREPIPLLDLNTGDSEIDEDDFQRILKHYYARRT